MLVGALWCREALSPCPVQHGGQWRRWQRKEQRNGVGAEREGKKGGAAAMVMCTLCASPGNYGVPLKDEITLNCIWKWFHPGIVSKNVFSTHATDLHIILHKHGSDSHITSKQTQVRSACFPVECYCCCIATSPTIAHDFALGITAKETKDKGQFSPPPFLECFSKKAGKCYSHGSVRMSINMH